MFPETTAKNVDSAAGTAARRQLEREAPARYKNHFLDSLTERVRLKIAPYLRTVLLAKDAYLFQQDEELQHVYFPLTAVVSRYQMLEDGRTIEVALTGREGSVGLGSALGSFRSTNCCQVCVGGESLRIGVDYVRSALIGEASVFGSFVYTADRNIRQISKRSICNHFHTVEQRLCTWILMVRDRSDGDRLNVTHDQVARSLGVHRPTVTAITSSLRERGVINYSRGCLTILRTDSLRKLACDCFAELSLTAA
ncbi:MAG: Crp/Fnr family transcriptional regulator [Pyrinomonadaceae bacterium]